MRAAIGVAGVLATGGIARAQTYPPETMDFTITLRDAGGNNNGIVEPGEVVDLRVTAEFWPPVGTQTLWNNYPGSAGVPGPVYGFAGSEIDVIGVRGSDTGTLLFEVPAPFAMGAPGTLVPATQSVAGSSAGQLVWLPILPGSQANPVLIFTGTWSPADYTPRTLEYRVDPSIGVIYLLFNQCYGEYTINSGSSASISIVPGPGPWLVLGVGGWLAPRRRR